jgi:hypothetical protein
MLREVKQVEAFYPGIEPKEMNDKRLAVLYHNGQKLSDMAHLLIDMSAHDARFDAAGRLAICLGDLFMAMASGKECESLESTALLLRRIFAESIRFDWPICNAFTVIISSEGTFSDVEKLLLLHRDR